MDNINTLLVAFMFITILTLGIAGILAELAEATQIMLGALTAEPEAVVEIRA